MLVNVFTKVEIFILIADKYQLYKKMIDKKKGIIPYCGPMSFLSKIIKPKIKSKAVIATITIMLTIGFM